MTEDKLTIFYDGNCPLCSLEMDKLKQHDAQNRIILENLHQAHFEQRFPDINVDKALKVLHGKYQNKLLLALDVTHRAWTLIGFGALAAPLQFPIIKQIAHGGYLLLAKYRNPISHFIYQRFGIGIKTCSKGTCNAKPNNTDHWR
jgi:predicted DCC family thiol-disulfide oxidoreductase YuxK